MNYKSLKSYYVILFISLIVFLFISTVSFFIHKETEGKINALFSNAQLTLAKLVAHEIKAELDTLVSQLHSATHNPYAKKMNIQNMPFFMKEHFKEVMYYDSVLSLIITDSKDEIIYYFPEELKLENIKKEYNPSFLKKHKATLKKGVPALSDFFSLQNSKKVFVNLYMPLLTNKDEYKGAYGILVDMTIIRRSILEIMKKLRSYDLFILNENGEHIETISKDWSGLQIIDHNATSTRLSNYSEFFSRVKGKKEVSLQVEYKTIAPNKAYSYIKKSAAISSLKIGDRTWYICIFIPYEEISFLMQKNFQYTLVILAVLLLFIFSVAYIMFEINRKRIRAEEAELFMRTETDLKSELALSEKKYKRIMDEALEGIVLFKGIEVIEANNAWLKMFEMTIEDATSMTLYDIVHRSSVDLVKDYFMQDTTNSDKPPMHYDIKIVNKKGEVRMHNISVFKLSAAERITCLVSRDVTEKRLEEKEINDAKIRLEKANEELDFYISSIVHDIKNPLIAVQGFVNIIAQDMNSVESENKEHYIDRIQNNVSHIFTLLESLLELSKIGRIKKQIQRIDLNKEISRIKDNLNPIIAAKNAKIVSKNLPVIYTDKILLTQILINLISNALKFCKKDITPIIEIGSHDKDNYIQIYVKDNGNWIEEKYFDLIFKVFGRISADMEVKGSGVGLNIVQKAVKELGG